MLPTKVFQLDYQDFSSLVWNHVHKIENYAEEHGFEYDVIISKLRNGVISGSILANYFGIPLGVIEAPRGAAIDEFKLFIPTITKKITNILLVDSICGTGETIKELVQFFSEKYPEIKVTTYVTLVDMNAAIKPDIIGELKKEFIQPPWEWMSFTPQSHLQRLEAGHIKAAEEKELFLGFSSQKCKEDIENSSEKFINYEWIKVFTNSAHDRNIVKATSGISSINIENDLTFLEYKNKFKKLIEEKVDFILSNGVSHYIEENMQEAILISQKCPVTHVFFFDGQDLHKIYSKATSFNEFKV